MDYYLVLAALSHRYPKHKGRSSTRYSPVRRSTQRPKSPFSHDLHVLSTSPAFNLSQDQTLQFEILVLAETQSTLRPNGRGLIQNHPTRYLIVKDPLRAFLQAGRTQLSSPPRGVNGFFLAPPCLGGPEALLLQELRLITVNLSCQSPPGFPCDGGSVYSRPTLVVNSFFHPPTTFFRLRLPAARRSRLTRPRPPAFPRKRERLSSPSRFRGQHLFSGFFTRPAQAAFRSLKDQL